MWKQRQQGSRPDLNGPSRYVSDVNHQCFVSGLLYIRPLVELVRHTDAWRRRGIRGIRAAGQVPLDPASMPQILPSLENALNGNLPGSVSVRSVMWFAALSIVHRLGQYSGARHV